MRSNGMVWYGMVWYVAWYWYECGMVWVLHSMVWWYWYGAHIPLLEWVPSRCSTYHSPTYSYWIPTGFQQNFQKGIFTYFFISPNWTPTGLLLDSYWIPTGLQLNLNKCHKLNPMVQILDSYWIPTGVSLLLT
jgi:hypothetical protein